MRASSLLILSSLLLFATPAIADREAADRLYAQGRNELSAGARGAAEDTFRKALKEDLTHGDAAYQLGLLLSDRVLGYAEAERLLTGVPGHSAKVALARLHIRSGKAAVAVKEMNTLATEAAGRPGVPLDEVYATLGLALYVERSYEEALTAFQMALKENPLHAAACFNLKTLRNRLEHFQAGKIYSRVEERADGIREFQTAISLDPRFVAARHLLGIELHLNGDDRGALREFRRVESLAPEYPKMHEIRFAEGNAFFGLKEWDAALDLYERVEEQRPNFAPVRNGIGRVYLVKGLYALAVREFQEAMTIDPRSEYARNMQIALARLVSAGEAVEEPRFVPMPEEKSPDSASPSRPQ